MVNKTVLAEVPVKYTSHGSPDVEGAVMQWFLEKLG